MTLEATIETPSSSPKPLAARLLNDRSWRLTCFSLAVCLIWSVGLFCVYSLRDAWQAGASAEHAQDVRFETDRLLLLLRESETGQRGYLLTGDDDFLKPYDRAVQLAPISISHLRQLTSDNPNQQRRLDRLQPLTKKRLDILQHNITNRQIKGKSSINVAAIITGKAVMEQIEKLAAAIIEEETEIYHARSDHGERQARFAIAALLLGLLLSTAAIMFMFHLMSREIARRRLAESEMKDMNATLEQKVAARTMELQNETVIRREAEEKLQKSTTFQDAVIEHVPAGLFVKDAKEHRFVLQNRFNLELLGFERDEMIGKNDYDFFPKEQADGFIARDRKVLISRQVIVTPEEPIATRYKGTRLLRTTKVPVLDKNGEPLYLLGFCEDITERKAIEQQLRQAVKMEAVGQLTGGIAHDFNNLLGVIIGNLDLMIERIKPEKPVKDLIDEALAGALRGAELVQRLLAFSRKQPLQPAAIDLNERLPEIAKMLRRTLGENIELKLNCGDDLWPALADASQTDEAILNLAINARDAMPNGGALTIETVNVRLDEDYASQQVEVTAGNYVMLAISDTGTGMEREVLERAFEPFFSTKGVGKGSGLGLSMVYGFVKQTGGHVKIYSEVGFGTTVKIYLPRAEAKHHADAKAESVEAAAAKGHEFILVVEDNDHMRAVTLKQMADLGYRTLEAENAKMALSILDEHPEIDLLFTDVIMPGGMTGCELAREVKKRRPDLKILLTSGYTQQAVANGCHDLKGLELLHKPFRKRDLAMKLRQTLDS
jgi:PAS domain S-box-containing protein